MGILKLPFNKGSARIAKISEKKFFFGALHNYFYRVRWGNDDRNGFGISTKKRVCVFNYGLQKFFSMSYETVLELCN